MPLKQLDLLDDFWPTDATRLDSKSAEEYPWLIPVFMEPPMLSTTSNTLLWSTEGAAAPPPLAPTKKKVIVPGADIGERAQEAKIADLAAACRHLEQQVEELQKSLETKTAALARALKQLELKIDAGF